MAETSVPPYPSFNNIDFNPSFFPNAASEYVEFPVAQGIETFSKIFATELDTPTPTADFNFLRSETGNINIGTLVPSTKTIKLGQTTGTSVHAGSIDITGTAINNNVAATTGEISLGNNQTSGVLNIGTGSRTGAGAINIGTAGTGAFNINVGTANQSTTTIFNDLVGTDGCIAGRSHYLTYNVSATIPSSTINLDLVVIFFGSTTGQTLTLPTNTTQRIYIKNYAAAGNDITISGGVMILYTALSTSSTLVLKPGEATVLFYSTAGWIQCSPTNKFMALDAKDASTALTLGSNLMTADLSIGGSQTDGGINIGASTARTTAGTINIGTRSTVANPIIIGSSTSTVSIGNTLAVAGMLTANGGITLPSGDELTITGTIAGTGNITTTGTITANTYNTNGSGTGNPMALGSNLTSGPINIGEFQTTGNINIGAGTARVLGGAGSSINIGTGSTVANPINIGSSTSEITLKSIIYTDTSSSSGCTSVLYGKTGYESVSANYTIPASINTNYFLRITGTGSPTITLPTPVQHQIITIRSTSTGSITVSATSATILIIGATSGTAGATITPGGVLKLYATTTSQWLGI